MAYWTKKFGKYEVNLEVRKLETPDEQESDCFISYKDFSASLECADATGVLENHERSTEHKIDNGTLEQIRTWAEANGY